ncbi:hypothetical protein FPV67DRAFT_1412255 [Lyophyllum atratum]|nr:hypothetical protein FPV67DRAFT_1412255 [Lyophyllum atratum]
MPAAHTTYTRELIRLQRGEPLYYPEPHPVDGPVQIAVVGYMKEGAFYTLFNASLPGDHPAQRFGVPEGFEPFVVGEIRNFGAALQPGPLHGGTVSTLQAELGTQGGVLPVDAKFTFKCTSTQGAILIPESGVVREEAVQKRRFKRYVKENWRSWVAFAESLDIDIGFGELMLVTECSKTTAWSSAVYSNTSSSEFSLTLSVGNPFLPAAVGASISAGTERTGAVECRASEKRAVADGPSLPNDHTIFIKAYRPGAREAYLRSPWVLLAKAWDSCFGERIDDGRAGSDVSDSSTSSWQMTSPLRSSSSDVMATQLDGIVSAFSLSNAREPLI